MTMDANHSIAAQALDDDALDTAVGGLTCAQGMKLSRVYLTLSKVAGAIGDTVTQAEMAGRGKGVLEGACS